MKQISLWASLAHWDVGGEKVLKPNTRKIKLHIPFSFTRQILWVWHFLLLSFSLLRGSGGPDIRNCLCYSLLPALDVGQYHPYSLHLVFNPQFPSLTCCSLGWQLRFLPAVPQLAVRQLQFFPTNAFCVLPTGLSHSFVPSHGRGVRSRWSLRLLPTQTILWCCDLKLPALKVHPKEAIFIQSFCLKQRASMNEPSLSHWHFRIKPKQLALPFPADCHWSNRVTRQRSVPREYHSTPLKASKGWTKLF